MKKVLIINGSGGVGKDTFVDQLGDFCRAFHESIVDPVKGLATRIGWRGEKTESARRLLSDLKLAVDRYNDFNYERIRKMVKSFYEGDPGDAFLCIDMREKEQIERAKWDFNAKTVLIVRDSVKHITSNVADAGVFDMEYDYVIENNGTLNDLREKAKQLFETEIQAKDDAGFAGATLASPKKIWIDLLHVGSSFVVEVPANVLDIDMWVKKNFVLANGWHVAKS